MSTEKIIITGLGRCGSSLLMQILDASGFGVLGEYPAYEDPLWNNNLLFAAEGKAAKVIDLQRSIVPTGRYKWIFLSRDYEQQAKSLCKFLSYVTGDRFPAVSNVAFTNLMKGLQNDEKDCREIISKKGGDILDISFEEFFVFPQLVLKKIADFLQWPDIVLCESVIEKRNSDCLPGLLELELINKRRSL